MAEIEGILPAGVRVKLESDESVELGKQLRDLTLRGAIAFGAVALILLLSLRHLLSVARVMGSAAIAIAGTALGLYLLNIPANLLTLAGLGMGIGILVQNGVVVVERLRFAEPTPEGRAEAGRRIAPAVLGATLTTAVVLLPFLYLQGNARAAFVPFAAAFALALGWSVLSSVVMIPAVGSWKPAPVGTWPRLHRFYRATLRPLVRFRWVTLVLVAGILGVVTWGFVKRVPRSSWGNYWGQRTVLMVSLTFPRGSDPESLDRGMREFESIAVGRPGVEKVETRSGRC
jgi:HAE1 family hydrophobic/amphiphilic exporter-1